MALGCTQTSAPEIAGDPESCEDGVMKTTNRCSPEVRERAIRLVFEHRSEYESQWAATGSVAEKVRCTPETLRKWLRRAERDEGKRPGAASDDP